MLPKDDLNIAENNIRTENTKEMETMLGIYFVWRQLTVNMSCQGKQLLLSTLFINAHAQECYLLM